MRELGVSAKRLRMMRTQTDKVPNTSATAASAGADLNGAAVREACVTLRARLIEVAAKLLTCAPEEVTVGDDVFRGGGREAPFAQVVERAYFAQIPLSATGFYRTPDIAWDKSVGQGRPFYYFAYGAAVTEVEVDGWSGMKRVLRTDIVQRLPGRRDVAVAVEVHAADGDRVHAQSPGDAVHVPLGRPLDLRRAEASKGTVRGRVRGHHQRLGACVLADIRPEGVDHAAAVHHGRERVVGAAVEEDVGRLRQELARRRVDHRAVARAHRVALCGRPQVLVAAVDELDGAAGLEREQAGVDRDE
jgi:hypothetical protein